MYKYRLGIYLDNNEWMIYVCMKQPDDGGPKRLIKFRALTREEYNSIIYNSRMQVMQAREWEDNINKLINKMMDSKLGRLMWKT